MLQSNSLQIFAPLSRRWSEYVSCAKSEGKPFNMEMHKVCQRFEKCNFRYGSSGVECKTLRLIKIYITVVFVICAKNIVRVSNIVWRGITKISTFLCIKNWKHGENLISLFSGTAYVVTMEIMHTNTQLYCVANVFITISNHLMQSDYYMF
jgi:hypothetical protein